MNNNELTNGIVISSRVRLARNLNDVPFPRKATSTAPYISLIDMTFQILNRSGKFTMYKMSTLADYEKEALKEFHLISNDLIQNRELGTAIISEDKTISVMLNEEDHLREQCVLNGFCLEEAYEKISKVDDELSKRFNIAFDKELGYLTAHLANLGTGMRASVMVFLPALTENGAIAQIIEEMNLRGFTVRGVYGEGSKAQGCLYQISNKNALGHDEKSILLSVKNVVIKICELEQKAREELLAKDKIETEDDILRAYGILTNAVKYSKEEFMRLMAKVKLGVYIGIIQVENKKELDKIIENAQPAIIMLRAGKELTAKERDLYRANMVKEKLKKLVKKI